MLIGINATKEAIYIAETCGAGETFGVEKITKVQFVLNDASDLADLFQTIKTLLAGYRDQQCDTIAILSCCAGRYASSIEAVKAEGLIQLAGHEQEFTIVPVKPQGLKSVLGCGQGEQWQAKSKELFNADGEHKYWSQGANGAAAAAYKATK